MEEAIALIENTAGKLAKHLVHVNIKNIRITGDVSEDDLAFLSNYIRLKENLRLYIEAAGTETIWNPIFAECESLTAIYLLKTKSIGSAFYGCTSLVRAELPENTDVWNWAFSGCTSLTSIHLPKAINIGDEAFQNCYNLTSVNLPNVLSIGRKAFYGCTSLTSICLPQTITIGNEAFAGCTALQKLVIAGREKSTIGYSALSTLPVLFLKEAVYPDAASLAHAWSKWGSENRHQWDRYNWPEIHSNYKGQGDLDNPDSYAIHWTRPTANK